MMNGVVFVITARANGHYPQRYLSVVLTESPDMTDIAGI